MSRLPQDIEERLAASAPAGIAYRAEKDGFGTVVAWCGLASTEDLKPVGQLLQEIGARLVMVTCTQPSVPEPEDEDDDEDADEAAEAEAKVETGPALTFGGTLLDGLSYEIDYHFDIGGDALTVIAYVPQSGSVPSLASIFRGADWHEREMMELYSVVVTNHPDPRRLFLDASIDGAVLERLIPFSTLTNAASTKGLWDKILGKKGAA